MSGAPPSDLTRTVRDFVAPVDSVLKADLSIGDALAQLRHGTVRHGAIYFYVVDKDNKLVGVMPTRQLLLANPKTPVRDLMSPNVVAVQETFTLQDVLEEFAIHRLLALPVVDADQHLIGFVDARLYADEAFDLAESQHDDNDLVQVIGLSVEQARHGTALAGYRLRMPWLVCNLFSGIVCAIIGALFRDVLDAVVLLAMFFPLVLTLSESISMQAMTIGLQFMHSKKVPWRPVRTRLNVEWKTALLLGVTGGSAVAVASLFFPGGTTMPPPAVVLGVSILLAMTASAIVGLGTPVILHAAKLDPRVASGPVVLMIADIMTTTVYLALATWMLL
ncbi:magnesium transporter [Phycisphaerales bacterium AB-hyl4]|uniref:Magnesium transporter n=1 Tax=Natronomicrosphaera hydrolytica TaxID=3242702 RepID=A0ABV4U3H8_9BACT